MSKMPLSYGVFQSKLSSPLNMLHMAHMIQSAHWNHVIEFLPCKEVLKLIEVFWLDLTSRKFAVLVNK